MRATPGGTSRRRIQTPCNEAQTHNKNNTTTHDTTRTTNKVTNDHRKNHPPAPNNDRSLKKKKI